MVSLVTTFVYIIQQVMNSRNEAKKQFYERESYFEMFWSNNFLSGDVSCVAQQLGKVHFPWIDMFSSLLAPHSPGKKIKHLHIYTHKHMNQNIYV